MDHMTPFLFFGLAVAVVAVIAIFAHLAAQRRRQALRQLAAQLGLQFQPSPGDIHRRYEGFSPFGVGGSRRSSNMLSGQIDGVYWEIFDYRYTTGSGKHRHTHHYQIVSGYIGVNLPKLSMRREGMFDKLASMVGFDDINFESEQFSRTYHVKCDDRKAAYDLIHPRMIEFLLSIEPLSWQVGGSRIMLHDTGTGSPAGIMRSVQLIQSFIAQIPQYVRQDHPLSPQGH